MIQLNFVLIVFLLTLDLTCFAQDELIRFGEKDSLEWNDFAGKVDSTSKFSAYALVYLGYNLEPFANGFIISTDALFSRNNSWVRHKTSNGLKHENYHLKLTELVRRRMVKELYKLRFDVTEIYEIIDDRLDNYVLLHDQDQDFYDRETNFGRNRKRQTELEDKIDSLLIELNDFRFQYIVIIVENNVRVKQCIMTDDISRFIDE